MHVSETAEPLKFTFPAVIQLELAFEVGLAVELASALGLADAVSLAPAEDEQETSWPNASAISDIPLPQDARERSVIIYINLLFIIFLS
jgi:hypothetical protein